jgi:hypothetical protein
VWDTDAHCTVTVSSSNAIPAGTEINCSGPDADHLVAVLDIKNGSATGQCAIGRDVLVRQWWSSTTRTTGDT